MLPRARIEDIWVAWLAVQVSLDYSRSVMEDWARGCGSWTGEQSLARGHPGGDSCLGGGGRMYPTLWEAEPQSGARAWFGVRLDPFTPFNSMAEDIPPTPSGNIAGPAQCQSQKAFFPSNHNPPLRCAVDEKYQPQWERYQKTLSESGGSVGESALLLLVNSTTNAQRHAWNATLPFHQILSNTAPCSFPGLWSLLVPTHASGHYAAGATRIWCSRSP